MEDIFELLVALLVIVIPLISKSKKKKQEKPGQKKPAKAPKTAQTKRKVDPDALKQTLQDVEKKINDWAEKLESEDEEDEEAKAFQPEQPKASAMQPQRLQAERLEPEPLIPQSMAIPLMQEVGMAEGQSHTDGAGCVGGSIEHDPQGHHQGMDFHPHGTHGYGSAQEASAVQRAKPAVSAAELRKAVIWKEILDQPLSMRE